MNAYEFKYSCTFALALVLAPTKHTQTVRLKYTCKIMDRQKAAATLKYV